MASMPTYLATVCLERNRWGSRRPSLRASEWIGRAVREGFDGVELWENHYLAADAQERADLLELRAQVAVFNTYAGMSDDPADAEQRRRAAEALLQLSVPAVKYNLGRDPAKHDEYRRNLLNWEATLPAACALLCECHPGSVLEEPDAAAAFLADLDPARFAAIAHISGDAAALQRWTAALGPRLRHVHVQCRTPEHATPAGRAQLAACVDVLRAAGFTGSAAVEFTRGIGPNERIEAIYANARADLAALREAWGDS